MLKTEAIKEFLKTTGNRHLTELYTPDMEVQVNVAQDNGKSTGGVYKGKRWRGWTDGETTWKSFRIPWNADTLPTYVDSQLNFNLITHVEGIGMTGWDWKNKVSRWVGYDFDSITNHKEGLTQEKMEELCNLLFEIDYVTVVKSTSGHGYHMYVFFEEPIPTETHTEHAAVARSLLGVMSAEVGYNFFNAVDCCGMVLWCYHRKQEGTDGLSKVKEGVKFKGQLPSNWRDHVEVTAKRRRKVAVAGNSNFDEIASGIRVLDLDNQHLKVLKWFKDNSSNERDWWWDSDHNMLVCHTFDLKRAHRDLQLKGIFYTNSSGSSRQNCYAFPAEDGSWIIRRHGAGVKEHSSWMVDTSGWTRCVYNAVADLSTCARANEGIENARGEIVFARAEQGIKALNDAGIFNVVLEDQFLQRNIYFKEKGDKLIISLQRETYDTSIQGFLANHKGDRWEKVINLTKNKKEYNIPDHLIRHLISQNTEAGWWIYARKQWIQQSRANVVTVLLSQPNVTNKNDIDLMMAKAILNPWELVNIPFAEIYPGNRQWNRNAAQFSCLPEAGACETWLQILNHVGTSLTPAVELDPWCIDNSIADGKDYLLCWIASMFQNPTEPLPYLFFVGPQNCGKSTLHEALALLVKRGYNRADNALINQQGFNAEIEGSVLCVVEETNLNKNKDASNRIKDWVTGKTISINTKHKTVYDTINTTHWIQCANDINYCPVFPGDTRVVVCRVGMPKYEIPKVELFNKLDKEKNAFLDLVLNIELPISKTRLAVPCLHTYEKQQLQHINSTSLEQFMREEIPICRGELVEFEELYHIFLNWLDPSERDYWTKARTARNYPQDYPYCKAKYGSNNITMCGNICLDKNKKEQPYEWFVNGVGRLERRCIEGGTQW